MRVTCEGLSREMVNFATSLNLNQSDQDNDEKLELVKKFVEFLESNNGGHKHDMHKHSRGHHGIFGRFGKQIHGGRHGHGGKHGHGKHQCGKHHGDERSYGRHGSRDDHHGFHKFGHRSHRLGLHGHHGKFKAQWIIDLTQDDQEQNMQRSQKSAWTSNNQGQRGVINHTSCKCTGIKRGCRRFGRWTLCPYKRNNTDTQDNACQTEESTNEEDVELPQENLNDIVASINIETRE